MKVINLKQRPEALETLGQWHQEEWQDFYPEWTLEDFIKGLEAALVSEQVPQTWVLSDDADVWGSVSLVESDLAGYEHYSPWLAYVYVEKRQRGHGCGKILIQEAMSFAREKTCYLYSLYSGSSALL